MGALVYLEATFLRNQIREVLRSPARLALWGCYLLSLLVLGLGRAHGATYDQPKPSFALSFSGLFTAFGAAFVAMIGGASAYHALGSIFAFRSRAEALIFTNAGIGSREVVRFLQLRKLLAPITRFLWTIVLNFMVLTPPHAKGAEIARVFVASILVAAIISTLEIPMFLLGLRGWRIPIVAAGALAAGLGTFFVLAGLVRIVGVDLVPAVLKPFDPGRFVAAITAGDGGAIWTLALVVAILVGIAFSLGDDVLPELYAASLKMFSQTARARSSNAGVEFVQSGHARVRIPPGAFALLWKSWIAFRRARGSVILTVGMALVAASIGLALGLVAHFQGDAVEVWETMATLIAFAALVPIFVVVTVADDLGKPIWWMTTPSLFWRLVMLTLGRSWRSALVVGTAPFVLVFFTGDPRPALLIYPTALCLWWALNASALAIYAAFPSRLDFRGPLYVFRVLATVAVTAPMLGIFAATIEHTGSLTFALGAASIAAICTGVPAIAFATWRLRYRGAATAMLERAA